MATLKHPPTLVPTLTWPSRKTISWPSIPPPSRSLTKTTALSCPPTLTNPRITFHLTLLITFPCSLSMTTKWMLLTTLPTTCSPIPHPHHLSLSSNRLSLTNASAQLHPMRHPFMTLALSQSIPAYSRITPCPPSIRRALVLMI